jgi:LCP family protein required for cell wall assembly
VTRYQASSTGRSAKVRFGRGLGWFFLVVLVIGAGIGGGAYLWATESLNSLGVKTKAGQHAEGLLAKLGSTDEPAIALIAGYDHRPGDGNSYAGSNSDTLMLLRADPRNHTLSLLSFPRDLNVPIYCSGNTIKMTERINYAWSACGGNGGPKGALDTVAHLAGGIKINYMITLDFRAFKQVVNRLHGVYMNVDRRYYNPLHSAEHYSAINLHPGYQKLNGGEALSYVRFRHLDSDIYRNGRQQLFMEALKQRLKSTITVSNFLDTLGIVHALKQNLEIIKPGGAPPTIGELKAYLGLLLGLPPGHLFRNAIPPTELERYVTPVGAEELKASPQAIARAVHSFLHPVIPKERKPRKPTGGTKKPSLPHSDISVLVLNGGNITGEASNTSYLLGRHGFDMKTLPITTPANAPQKKRNTIVYYDPSQENGLKAAQELAPLFGSHHFVTEMTPAIASLAQKADGPLTVVAIGTAYKGKLNLPHASKPRNASTAHAQVTSGVSLTLSAVRAENGPAHFQLMFPKKVALGSTLSTEEGVRLFRPLRGRQELALTFNLWGGIEYWQIEESDWTSEPLLQNPTSTFTYKGRTYKEFTTGGKIQTIAVYVGHSVYWVQNTILNHLSNSTMIAIAEGLQPLR